MIGIEDVMAAADRLLGVAHRTPVLTSRTLDELTGARVFLKAENFQRTGSFKFRGAYNRISSLPGETLRSGVVAYSSGNHAQAVALAARLAGTRAVILMPSDAPPEKLAATKGYGAEVVPYDRYTDDRVTLARALAAERRLTLVPPFDDPVVMAGQGTAGLELCQDVPDLDLLLVPVGGGGLIAGCGTAAKAVAPGIRVAGVEPEASDDTKQSLERGEIVRLPEIPRTIADGLQLASPGELSFQVNREVVDVVLLVSEEEIVRAMRFLMERMKVVVEPSGAVAVAALLAGKAAGWGTRIGAILSGGNVSATRLRELTASAGSG